MEKVMTKVHEVFTGNYEKAMKIFYKQPEGMNMTCLGETYEYFRNHPDVVTNWILWTIEA